MQKILVLRGGALGDFIVTLPALALLKQRWPAARVELVGNATAAQLIHRNTESPPAPRLSEKCHLLDDTSARRLIDRVHSQHEARWRELYAADELSTEFARWLADFDLVVNYWPDPEGELRRHFPLRAEQKFISASAAPTKSPAAAHYCEPLRALGLEATNYFFPLTNVQPRVAKRIAIHPGSGSPRKNWPTENWSALCDWLREKISAELRIVVGEAETNLAETFADHGRILENLPLTELASELTSCRLFLGHDSGVSHLAAACGAPCVLLFGPTDPAMWAPPAPHVRVIRRGVELNSVSIEDVQAAVTSALADRA